MLLENLKSYKVILASQSPRRQQLLGEIVPDFQIKVKSVDEKYPEALIREEIVLFLSALKSQAFGALATNEMVITADTIVCLGNQVLEKPRDEQHSFEMLRELCGQTHTVFTGVTVRTNEKTKSFYDATDVTFHNLMDDEIKFYIQKCQPFDKAGSYGIQEWMGYVGIERMNGEFYNVMGLPLHKLYQELKNW